MNKTMLIVAAILVLGAAASAAYIFLKPGAATSDIHTNTTPREGDTASTSEDMQKPVVAPAAGQAEPATPKPSPAMTTPLEQYTAYLNRMKELYAKSARTPAEEAEATSIQQKMSPLYTQILAADSKSLEATLTADASDHDLTITINGMDIGFTGQSNTSSRLYTTQHFMKDLVIPELRKLFVLKEGENTIKVTYHKAVPNGFPLELTLATKDADLLHIKASGKTDGVIEKTFTISRTSTGAPTIEVVE